MVLRIFAVGSTGTFAEAILKEITDPKYKDQFQVTIMAHSLKSEDKKKQDLLDLYSKRGAKLVEGDALEDPIDEIAEKMKGHSVILSIVGPLKVLGEGQRRLIRAAEKAKVDWFIPSEFGMANQDYYQHYGRGNLFGYDVKVDIQEELKRSSLDWTVICTGPAMDLIVSGRTPVFDFQNYVVRTHDFQDKLTLTCLKDVGKTVAQVLLNQDKVRNQYLYVGAETLTFEEITQKLEKQFGREFKRETVDLDKLPSDNMMTSVYKMNAAKKGGMWWDPSKNWQNPSLKLTSLEEYLREHF